MFIFWLLLLVPKAPTPKFCVDCKHYMKTGSPEFGKCALFQITEKSDYLVTGKCVPDNQNNRYCLTARLNEAMCGEDGKHYEAMPKFSYFSISKNA